MKVVILGAGKVGYGLARRLIEDENEVVIIEKDPDLSKRASSQLDCMVLNEDGNSLDVLRKAGLDQSDFFVAVTGSDELNMISCGLAANEFPNLKTVARVRNVEYSTSKLVENPLLGITYFVNPEIEVSRVITGAIQNGVLGNVLTFEHSDIEVRTHLVGPDFPHLGQSLQSLRQKLQKEFLIPVVDRDSNYLIPTGQTVIEEGDVLYIMGDDDAFAAVAPSAKKKKSFRRILMIGGSHIGIHVADNLLSPFEGGLFKNLYQRLQGKQKPEINFIETDYEKCKELTTRYPNSTVIHGDISDDGILEHGSYGDADIILSLTGNQELNIISAMYAKRHGITQAVALLEKASYETVAMDLGIDMAYSVNKALVNSIFSLIRRGRVRSVHAISGGALEVVELEAGKESPICYQSIQDMKMPSQTLILLVIREGKGIFPSASTRILESDRVLILCPSKQLKTIEGMF